MEQKDKQLSEEQQQVDKDLKRLQDEEQYKPKKVLYPLTLDVLDNMDEKTKKDIFMKEQIFEEIFQDHPFDIINELSSNSMDNVDIQFTYGEISFEPFAQVFYILKKQFNLLQEKGGIFYDLGCGTAKPAIAASFCHQFDRIVGVEYVQEVYEALQEIEKIYKSKQQSIEKQLSELDLPDYKSPATEFKKGDYFKLDWSDGNIVFVNSTCLDSELMVKISDQALKLKPGSIFICTTYEVPEENTGFKNLVSFGRMFSWGPVTIHIYQRI